MWIDRILATVVAIVLGLQPVVRAGSTSAANASSSPRACCCASERATSCCRRSITHRDPGLPTVHREACGCELRAPIAPLAFCGTAESSEVKSGASAWAQERIAVGACVSAATPIPRSAVGPDPPDATELPAPARREPSSAVLRARGIHALLASFGTLLR
jgi:hypothetical protein